VSLRPIMPAAPMMSTCIEEHPCGREDRTG
jgi:hypothetical protein